MDGFFEKYGRLIIVAVAVCFVILFLTPMRGAIGGSVDKIAGDFANTVDKSLGKVRTPDNVTSIMMPGGQFHSNIPNTATYICCIH